MPLLLFLPLSPLAVNVKHDRLNELNALFIPGEVPELYKEEKKRKSMVTSARAEMMGVVKRQEPQLCDFNHILCHSFISSHWSLISGSAAH